MYQAKPGTHGIPISLLSREAILKMYEESNAMLNVQIALNHKLNDRLGIAELKVTQTVVCPKCQHSFKSSDSII